MGQQRVKPEARVEDSRRLSDGGRGEGGNNCSTRQRHEHTHKQQVTAATTRKLGTCRRAATTASNKTAAAAADIEATLHTHTHTPASKNSNNLTCAIPTV